MSKKGQAAMEFLMTYGWAIIIVLAAIGALAYFGVLSPQKLLPDRTTFTAPLPNVDNAVVSKSANTIEIAFRNNKGVSVTIPGAGTSNGFVFSNLGPGTVCNTPSLVVESPAGTAIDNATAISNGAGYLMRWTCTGNQAANVGDKFKADITYDYVNAETGQTIKQTGSVEGKYS